jgi:hypothetical protein
MLLIIVSSTLQLCLNRPTIEKVLSAAEIRQQHTVEYNINHTHTFHHGMSRFMQRAATRNSHAAASWQQQAHLHGCLSQFQTTEHPGPCSTRMVA